jgi:fructose 5-dehydrogenase small subunit
LKDLTMSQEQPAHAPQRKAQARAACPSRRTFLAVAAGAALAALTSGSLPIASLMPRAMAAQDAEAASSALRAAFLRLSMFVTGQRDLDQETGARFYAALSHRDPAFAAKIGALITRIDEAKFADMDAFLAATPADSALFGTAKQVVSAWYLGIVGEAADAELITYAESLMYRPTRGVLAVPTYGPGPLAWGDKPATA